MPVPCASRSDTEWAIPPESVLPPLLLLFRKVSVLPVLLCKDLSLPHLQDTTEILLYRGSDDLLHQFSDADTASSSWQTGHSPPCTDVLYYKDISASIPALPPDKCRYHMPPVLHSLRISSENYSSSPGFRPELRQLKNNPAPFSSLHLLLRFFSLSQSVSHRPVPQTTVPWISAMLPPA